MVLKRALRVLHLDSHATEVKTFTRSTLHIHDLKTHLHIDTLPPTKPPLPVVPLPVGKASKPMSQWGPCLLKPPHVIMLALFIVLFIRLILALIPDYSVLKINAQCE